MASWKHVRDPFRVVFKKRTFNRRMYLLLAIVIYLFIISPIYGELTIRYLYVRTRYGWEVAEYSKYTTFESSLIIIGTLYFCQSEKQEKFQQSISRLFQWHVL